MSRQLLGFRLNSSFLFTKFYKKGYVNGSKKIKKQHIQALLKRTSAKSKKSASAFFGKLKDGMDGLAYQKKLRDEWK